MGSTVINSDGFDSKRLIEVFELVCMIVLDTDVWRHMSIAESHLPVKNVATAVVPPNLRQKQVVEVFSCEFIQKVLGRRLRKVLSTNTNVT